MPRSLLLGCGLAAALVTFHNPRAAAQGWFQTGQDAELMLSGIGFNDSGGPLLFNHPNGIASDGTRFVVCDRFNNRVLVWNAPPTAWNDAPDAVLGQPDFTSNNPGTSKSGMNWPGNASIGAGGVLAVADTENDRILVWNSFPAANGEPADVVLNLGAYSIPGQMPFEWPWGVWTDGTRLAAVATMGATILIWDTMPTSDDAPSSFRIKLPEFGTPRNISSDGTSYFFVGDHNARVGAGMAGTFFWNSFPTAENQPHDFFRTEWIKGERLPSGHLVAGGLSSIYIWDSVPTTGDDSPDLTLQPLGYANGDGVDVAYAGGRVYVNNYNGNNVQVYNTLPTSAGAQPDFALGCPSPSGNTLPDLNYIQNPVLATDGARLIATSDFDRSLWIWNQFPTTSGVAPDLKVSLQPWNLMPWDNAVHAGRLVVGGKESVAVWNSIPSPGQSPDKLFTGSIGSAVLADVRGVALDDRFLYVADRSGAIHVWQGIPSSSAVNPVRTLSLDGGEPNHIHSDGTHLAVAVQTGPPSIRVYRVDDIENQATPVPLLTIPNGGALALNLPGDAMTFGSALAVANTSGNAVYVWKELADWGDPSKVVVLGQDSVGIGGAAIGSDRLFMPASLMFDGANIWVGELKFSSRILKFAPLGSGASSAGYWSAYD